MNYKPQTKSMLMRVIYVAPRIDSWRASALMVTHCACGSGEEFE